MKKVLCSAEKSSVIWAEPHRRSSAEQFGRTERWVYHYHSALHLVGIHKKAHAKESTETNLLELTPYKGLCVVVCLLNGH